MPLEHHKHHWTLQGYLIFEGREHPLFLHASVAEKFHKFSVYFTKDFL